VAADRSAPELPAGPIVFGYDGSPGSERAIRMTAPLLAPKRALVVTVWEPTVGFEVLPPTIVPAPLDIRAALEIDESIYEGARRMAEQGAAIARQLGLGAEGLAVADVLTVASSLVRLVRERDAPAIVVGTRGHSPVRQILVGSTARDVIRRAPCPVTVVNQLTTGGEEEGEGVGET
jgi:nucleotide-binding universal stress UspA family protein